MRECFGRCSRRSPVAGTSVPGYSPPSAMTDLTEVIRLRHDHTEAYFWRAVLRAPDPDPKALPSAVEDCEKALSVSPGDPAVGALRQKLKIEQRARERSAEQAAIATLSHLAPPKDCFAFVTRQRVRVSGVSSRCRSCARTATTHNARHQRAQDSRGLIRECARSSWSVIAKSGRFSGRIFAKAAV